jgi:hypothetical protein
VSQADTVASIRLEYTEGLVNALLSDSIILLCNTNKKFVQNATMPSLITPLFQDATPIQQETADFIFQLALLVVTVCCVIWAFAINLVTRDARRRWRKEQTQEIKSVERPQLRNLRGSLDAPLCPTVPQVGTQEDKDNYDELVRSQFPEDRPACKKFTRETAPSSATPLYQPVPESKRPTTTAPTPVDPTTRQRIYPGGRRPFLNPQLNEPVLTRILVP